MQLLKMTFVNNSFRACGCKGIRSCRLCEQSFTKNRMLHKLHKQNENVSKSDKKTFYYCLNGKKAYHLKCVHPQILDTTDADNNHGDVETISHSCIFRMGTSDEIQQQNKTSSYSDISCTHERAVSEMDFQGIRIIENFISSDEETILDSAIKETPFQNSQSGRRKQDFGPKVNFKKQKIKVSTFNGLPPYSQFVYKRMGEHSCLKDFQPVELCNLEYCSDRGAHIDPHFDDAWLWGERLVTLNLMADSCLTFTLEANPSVEVKVPLLRRSLIVVSSDARYRWKHSISEGDIMGRRVAMTFRELSHEFSQGGGKEEEGMNLLRIALTFQGTAIQVNV